MKNSIALRIIVAVVVSVFVVGTWVQDGELDLGPLKLFSTAVFACTAILFLWDYRIWRFSSMQMVPGVPRSLRGTWKGTLNSYWIDPETGQPPPVKSVFLVVRQSASNVTTTLFTDESKSTSSLARVSEADGQVALSYLYMNKPKMGVEEHSRVHHGSAMLDVSGKPAAQLRGRYWTDRDSRGELEFVDRDSKNLADDFTSASRLFPNTA